MPLVAYITIQLLLKLIWKERHVKTTEDAIKKPPWPESESELYRPRDRRVSAKLVPTFLDRGCHVVSVMDGSLRPYSRLSRREPLLVLPSSPSVVLTRLSGPSSRPTTSQKIW
jgi:hypothetical protein